MDLNIFDKKEDLHPDLVSSLSIHPQLGQILHHPLVVQVPYSPALNAWINQRYLHLLTQTQKYLDEYEWERYIFAHERPYRFEVLNSICESILPGKHLGDCISSVWIDSENIHENLEEWIDLFLTATQQGAFLMDEEDWDRFIDLPPTITIYRGIQYSSQKDGLSWTLDRDKAIWFSKRWQRKGINPRLLTGKINKEDVIAYYGARGESEIVCFPEHVYDIEEVTIHG